VPLDPALVPILRALLARLVPADDAHGAVEIGAEIFILSLLDDYPEWSEIYRIGLSELSQIGFDNLTVHAQDEALHRLEQEGSQFLHLAAQNAIEAFYTGPTGLELVGFQVTG
jgi:hypothetical protein